MCQSHKNFSNQIFKYTVFLELDTIQQDMMQNQQQIMHTKN